MPLDDAPNRRCWDDPQQLRDQPACLFAVSKNVRGELRYEAREHRGCLEPPCSSLRLTAMLQAALTSNTPCDDGHIAAFNGDLVVRDLALAFAGAEVSARGLHAGNFEWRTFAGLVFRGQLSGTVNAGLFRPPAYSAAERCHEQGVLYGRLCGRVVDAPATQHLWIGAHLLATYRLTFELLEDHPGGELVGTLEGAVTQVCGG